VWGGAWVVTELRWGWFDLSQGQGMNKLYTFAIEKKAQRKTRMFNFKYNTKSYML
jgi:hypothetical protein